MESIGKIDQELDSPRIDEAFRELSRSVKNWPTPAQAIELLPPRPRQDRIDYHPGPITKDEKIYAKRAFLIMEDIFAGNLTRVQANKLMTFKAPFVDKYGLRAERFVTNELENVENK